jgi:enamine deaminase RidA (YjgF/YER057c/UK114 family)
MPIERRHTGKRLSESVVFIPAGERMVYLAGQVAEDPSGDITAQARSVLNQIDRLLAEVGSDKTQILSATIYLPSMQDFPQMNAVWDTWVPQGQTPARATVEAKLAGPAYRIEVQVVAIAPSTSTSAANR